MSLFFEVIFQNNSNDRLQVGSYVLSFRPVALQIRTIPGGEGWGVGKHVVIMLASPAELGLGLSLAKTNRRVH